MLMVTNTLLCNWIIFWKREYFQHKGAVMQ